MDVVHSVEYRPRSTDLSPGYPLLWGAYNATKVTWGRSLPAAYAFASRTSLTPVTVRQTLRPLLMTIHPRSAA